MAVWARPRLVICGAAYRLGVIEAVYSSEGEGELLPFWRLYIEQNYRPRWLPVGKYLLRERGGRSYVVHRYPGGLEATVADHSCAEAIGITVERFRDVMAHGSRDERLELLRRFVEKSKGALDSMDWDGEGYAVHHLQTPTEAFIADVLEGKIFDPGTGLKLSLRQAQGRPPEGGFLQKVVGGSEDYYKAVGEGRLGYRRGVVVKICGDYDPALREHHNTWAVILRVIDPWHYLVVKEWTGERLVIRDTDVKAIIGDALHDYVGIGEERHRKEVIPIIRKALEGKIPIPEGSYPTWPRPPIYQALVVARVNYGGKNLKRSVERALRDAEKRLRRVERNRARYEPEDYRRERGKALLWVRLYTLLLRRLEALEGGGGARLAARREWGASYLGFVRERLLWEGIPFKEAGDGIYVCREDYGRAVKAILNREAW